MRSENTRPFTSKEHQTPHQSRGGEEGGGEREEKGGEGRKEEGRKGERQGKGPHITYPQSLLAMDLSSPWIGHSGSVLPSAGNHQGSARGGGTHVNSSFMPWVLWIGVSAKSPCRVIPLNSKSLPPPSP